jgi:hypothetical protein
VYLGFQTGSGVRTGGQNIFIGANAGGSGGDVASVIAIGGSALLAVTGNNNTAVGFLAGGNNTSGTFNTYIGSTIQPNISTGSNNTIIGANLSTLGTNPTGLVVMGDGSGKIRFWSADPFTATDNIGIGHAAGNFGTSASQRNISIGNGAGTALTSGASNISIGTLAGTAISTGSFNTLVGSYHDSIAKAAGSAITTGSNNTIIGMYPGTSTMASQVILSDGSANIVVQYDQPNATWQTQTTVTSSLPVAGVIGRRAFVTDAALPVFGNAVVGSGAVPVPVYDDGSTWKVG